jgi:UDP-3-O-[3-hydroxymyristoyl] glucosamine N-acyltransferase
MAKTLGELAALVGGELRGPEELLIRGIAPVEQAGPEDITFIAHPRFARQAATCRAGAFIVGRAWADLDRPRIVVEHPYLAYAQVAGVFAPPRPRPVGISPLAHLGEGVVLGAEAAIGPFACLGDGVRLGDRVTIMPGCYLGPESEVGDDSYLSPGVVLMERCRVGARVLIHSGAVIGADGFGFVPTPRGQVKIPQLGIVVIEDDVEIGANVTIDRGALGETRISRGVKIDNLVQVAHNVTIGPHTVIAAQAGIAGSARVGAWAALGGQAGINGHITLGDRVQVGAQAGVTNSVPDGEIVLGSPAWPIREARRVFAGLHTLPELYQRVRHLEQLAGSPGPPGNREEEP